jgi:hypothetical protein
VLLISGLGDDFEDCDVLHNIVHINMSEDVIRIETVWFAIIFLANFRIESFSLVSPATRTLGAPKPNLNFSLLLDTLAAAGTTPTMPPRTIGMYRKDN